MQIVSPLERSAITSSDRVLFEIQRAIVEGDIAAGCKISEPELARRFNVSRAPLREALARLERCHLIERIPNAGARVVTLSLEGLISLYQIREELEGLACRLAAEQMPDNEIDELRQLLDKHLQTQRVREGESYYQEAGDLDFHYRIILGSKNQYLINMLCDELYYLVRMYRVQMGMNGPRVSRAFDEHKAIINAIANRDGELADLLMRRHIGASRKNIELRLQTEKETS
ncbi:GntR family transcriptional regulator [Idiomarina loihiensis]|jgi:DNA-binding GntR family transcriptional regulator|uniref:Transcriptional regulator, GntR family n=1 Tax=Idiomarina loihiensis (strain ATCC BAA-735 / DSM 15497 / L2-TR) TaxID=283942 RepID=Q5QZU3_IDILO|nr:MULTISPECIES: GntR family transcriptional regulator [Idiomarina]NWO02905.1 GntR family transcriptional regulator [Idiomarinaceae bacterium]AAV82268.1 Transcriptional regulator, GntR family [Idiomarina loihiensis L2TR]AGM36298.1 GntR family transcriptional regulator [Idiomarina loihiensis GSL 199]MBL4855393.1 GntR family transcriptional regulator [Idiomarina sp.]MRJ44065.1 FCD domain-containing protein [Idiomarina loihiensis]|tara:strand:- start:131 stop:820 length:690 start_codon:yes stop_codon:yes gene_type:complete